MIIIMDRGRCSIDPTVYARCPAACFQNPLDTSRPCLVKIIDDGDDEWLSIVLLVEGKTLRFNLTDETVDGIELEGWEFLADFDPTLVQLGAADRWRELADNQPFESSRLLRV